MSGLRSPQDIDKYIDEILRFLRLETSLEKLAYFYKEDVETTADILRYVLTTFPDRLTADDQDLLIGTIEQRRNPILMVGNPYEDEDDGEEYYEDDGEYEYYYED